VLDERDHVVAEPGARSNDIGFALDLTGPLRAGVGMGAEARRAQEAQVAQVVEVERRVGHDRDLGAIGRDE
jgi:hypothetical protein